MSASAAPASATASASGAAAAIATIPPISTGVRGGRQLDREAGSLPGPSEGARLVPPMSSGGGAGKGGERPSQLQDVAPTWDPGRTGWGRTSGWQTDGQ